MWRFYGYMRVVQEDFHVLGESGCMGLN